jgi:predicted nucleotidyltransferase
MDAQPAAEPRIPIDRDRIAAFCRKWHIVEFSLFGSVLTDEFRPDSDVDVLVEFAKDGTQAEGELLTIHAELESMFGREVDIVMRKYLKNPFRRHHILTHKQVIYAA